MRYVFTIIGLLLAINCFAIKCPNKDQFLNIEFIKVINLDPGTNERWLVISKPFTFENVQWNAHFGVFYKTNDLQEVMMVAQKNLRHILGRTAQQIDLDNAMFCEYTDGKMGNFDLQLWTPPTE